MKKQNPALGWKAMVQVVERNFAEKDLVVPLDSGSNTTQQCTPDEKKANSRAGCISKRIANQSRKVIVPLCLALLRPHPNTYVWYLSTRKMFI